MAWTAIALFAVVLLAMVFGPHRIGDYWAESDFYGGYAEGARLVQHGQLIPSRYGVIGPVYETALAVAGLPIRDLFRAAELLSVVATIATLILWFHLLARRSNARLALIATLFMVTNAYFFRSGYSATTDALAMALQAGAMFLLLTANGTRRLAVAGLVSALAFLTRYNAVYLVPIGLITLLVGRTHPSRWRAGTIFLTSFAAPVGLWVVYSLVRGAHFQFHFHHVIAYEVFAHAKGIPWDDYQESLESQFRTPWDVIARDPRAVLSHLFANLGDHLRRDAVDVLGWPVALAAACGVVLGIADGMLKRLWQILAAGALLFMTLVPVIHAGRYSLPLVPVYAVFAGIAFASPLGAAVIARRVWLKSVFLALLLAVSLRDSVRLQAHDIDQLPTEVLEASRTLRELKRPGDRIIARKPHIAFYGGVELLPFPFVHDLQGLAAFAGAHQARWLFMSIYEARIRPELMYMLDTSATVPGLTVRAVTTRHPAVLYEIGPEFGTTPSWFGDDMLASVHRARARLLVNPSDAEALYILGTYARLRNDLPESRRYLEMAVSANGQYFDALLGLGETALRQRNYAVAAEAYARAEALQPRSVAARLGKGWASMLAGQQRRAAEEWRPIVEYTQDRATLELMVELYNSIGDREAATKARLALQRLRSMPEGPATPSR